MAALPLLEQSDVNVLSMEDVFDEIDVNGGREILFDEFTAWPLCNGLDIDQSFTANDGEPVVANIVTHSHYLSISADPPLFFLT